MLLEAGSARTHQVRVGSSPSHPPGLERHQRMRPQGLWALGPSAGSAGQVSMTPGEPGGGGGLVRLTCAEKPGPLRVQGCPGGHDCWDRVLPQPRVQAAPPYSLGVLRSRGRHRRTGTASRSCWARSPQWVAVPPAALSPSALQEGQAEEPALSSGRQLGWVEQVQPRAVPKSPQKPQGLQPETWGRTEPAVPPGASVWPLPAARPAPHTPERCAEPHLRPPSPRSTSRPKAKSGLSRTQWSECPWQSFPPPGDLGGGGSCPALGRGGTGAPES